MAFESLNDSSQGGYVEPELTWVQRFGEGIADRVERWMPSPFVFAIILTYVAGLAAYFSEGSTPVEVALAWYGGFWNLLQFAMQMVIILVTGFVVAYHPKVLSGITRLVALPQNGRQAVVLVGVGSMIVGWISWGLGLIFGAILAREMGKSAAKKGMAVHYPLLAVAGYMGMSLTWGWGTFEFCGIITGHRRQCFYASRNCRQSHTSNRMGFSFLSTAFDRSFNGLCIFDDVPTRSASRELQRY